MVRYAIKILCIDHNYDVVEQSGIQLIVQDCNVCYKIVNNCAFNSVIVCSHCLILYKDDECLGSVQNKITLGKKWN